VIKVILGLAAAMVVSSTQAQAQAQAPAAQDVSRQQAQQLADSLFQRLDTNHDGTVTRQEADAVVQAAGGHGHMIERMFGAAQSLTLAQFEAGALALFDAEDTNHDGTVSAAEREQARALRTQQKQGQ
jgi:L-2-hydroxyglutarate oxidase LhgO